MFKKAVISLFIVCVALSASFAAPKASSELSFGAEYVQTSAVPNPWSATIALGFPVGKHLKLGPEVTVGSADELNRMGVGLDFNVFGDAAVTPFVGVGADYFQKSVDGLDSYTVIGRGGFKVRVGKGAFLKVFVADVVDGRGKAETDLSGGASIVALF